MRRKTSGSFIIRPYLTTHALADIFSSFEARFLWMHETQILEKLKEIYRNVLDIHDPDSDLSDDYRIADSGLSLDSVESLELIIAIEKTFKLSLDPSRISMDVLSSLKQTYDVVREELNAC